MSDERNIPFRKTRRQVDDDVEHPTPQAQVSLPPFLDKSGHRPSLGTPTPTPPIRKRGRPATGKRSDPEWIGRTYYVKRATDLDVEGVLFKLKCQGIEIDKSELVNNLLGVWVLWQQSNMASFPLEKVLPHRH